MAKYSHVSLQFAERSQKEMRTRARQFYRLMAARRSVRAFSDRVVPKELIEDAIRTAGTAPSGVHRQPWRFVAVSDPALKRKIRIAAEAEEYESYHRRMPPEWLKALAPLGTDWHKPYLETAPWIVVCFAEFYGIGPDGKNRKNYYVQESCGMACGLFIAALHHMGLVTLTHTPSPMRFLRDILGRPSNERAYVLFPVGYPSTDATVPDIPRKPLCDISAWHESA